MPACKRSGPTTTAGHISAKRSPGPPGARGELRTHSHLEIKVPPRALPSLPRTTTRTASINDRGRGHGHCAGLAPARPSLCGHQALRRARGALPALAPVGRAHFGVEREGDRASPSVNSRGRWARLPRVPRDGQIKVQIWVGGADKGNSRGEWVGVSLPTITSIALRPPEGAGGCGLLSVPGGLSSGPRGLRAPGGEGGAEPTPGQVAASEPQPL